MRIMQKTIRPGRMFTWIIVLLVLTACQVVNRTPIPTATVDDMTLAETVDATAVIIDSTMPPATSEAYPVPQEQTPYSAAEAGYPVVTQLPLESVEDFPLTPPQIEGPYYPDEKPDDSDEELIFVKGHDGQAQGEVLQLNGVVLYPDGEPVSGAVVEIWQADSNGIYGHPDDPQYSQRDKDFQFYGESVADENGNYAFTTIIPGEYGVRPKHIHVKVKYLEETLLTTQFYFAGDERLDADTILDEDGESLILDPQPVDGIMTATMPIIVPEQ